MSDLVAELRESLARWDEAFNDVFEESQGWPFRATEEKLKVAVRNEMRRRGHEIPEVVRWKLRLACGYRPEEE